MLNNFVVLAAFLYGVTLAQTGPTCQAPCNPNRVCLAENHCVCKEAKLGRLCTKDCPPYRFGAGCLQYYQCVPKCQKHGCTASGCSACRGNFAGSLCDTCKFGWTGNDCKTEASTTTSVTTTTTTSSTSTMPTTTATTTSTSTTTTVSTASLSVCQNITVAGNFSDLTNPFCDIVLDTVTVEQTNLTSLVLPNVISFGGEMIIDSNYKLLAFSIPKAVSIAQYFLIRANNLASFEAPSLQTAGFSVQFVSNHRLTSISMNALTYIGSLLNINSNPQLTFISLSSIQSINGQISICSNGASLTLIGPVISAGAINNEVCQVVTNGAQCSSHKNVPCKSL